MRLASVQTSRFASQRLFVPSERGKVATLCAAFPTPKMKHDDTSGVPVSGLVALLRGSDEQRKKESVWPPAMWLERHAEPSVLENTQLPARSVS
eukprot:scaffold81251_cov63-Phaeocystis_antarctica.AAC.3